METRRAALVLEDDPAHMALLEELIRDEPGWEPVGVASVAAARRALETTAPDAVFVDLRLAGEELEGLMAFVDLCRARGVHVVVTTALPPASPLRAAAEARGLPVLDKPFRVEDLAEALADAARRRPHDDR